MLFKLTVFVGGAHSGGAHSGSEELGGLLQSKFKVQTIQTAEDELYPLKDYNPACNLVMLEDLTQDQKHDGQFLFDKMLPKCDKTVQKSTCELLLHRVFDDWHFPASCPALKDVVAAHIARTTKSEWTLPVGTLMKVKGKCLDAYDAESYKRYDAQARLREMIADWNEQKEKEKNDASLLELESSGRRRRRDSGRRRVVTARDCDYKGSDDGQIWSIDNKDRIVMTRTVKDWKYRVTPKCLDIYHSKCHNGASIILHKCGDQDWQKWGSHKSGQIESKHCRGKCLDVFSSGQAKMYDCQRDVPQQTVQWEPLGLTGPEYEEFFEVGALRAPCTFEGMSTQPDQEKIMDRSYMSSFFLEQCELASTSESDDCKEVFQDVFDEDWGYPNSCEVLEDLVQMYFDEDNLKMKQNLLQRSQVGHELEHGHEIAHANFNDAVLAKQKKRNCQYIDNSTGVDCQQTHVDATNRRKDNIWKYVMGVLNLVVSIATIVVGAVVAFVVPPAGAVIISAGVGGAAATPAITNR